MNWQAVLSNAWVVVKLSCLATLIIHLVTIVYDKHFPDSYNAITEQIQLDKIDFPAILKVCMKPSLNKTEVRKVGYKRTFDYFSGQSKYDKQIFGWSGHTEDGQPYSNASDVQKRLFQDYFSAINTTWIALVHNDSFEVISIPTSSYKFPQPNYPNNCLILDVANIPEVKGKTVDYIWLSFNRNTFATEVDINIEDRCKTTKRHNMYSKTNYQGATIWLDEFSKHLGKTYMVSFKQDVFLEEDINKNCVIYPTEKFTSYEDCDDNFLVDLLKNETLHPAWATPEDLSQATKISKGNGLNYKTANYVHGSLHSPCNDPCTVTSFQSFYSFTEYHTDLPHLVIDLNPVVEVTRHVIPKYGLDLFLLDLGGCSGLWLGISVTQALEVAIMAMAPRIRDCLDIGAIHSLEN